MQAGVWGARIRVEWSFLWIQAPYQVNMMMAGFDKRTGPSLYYLDYIATLQKLEKGALGFGELTTNFVSKFEHAFSTFSLLIHFKSAT